MTFGLDCCLPKANFSWGTSYLKSKNGISILRAKPRRLVNLRLSAACRARFAAAILISHPENSVLFKRRCQIDDFNLSVSEQVCYELRSRRTDKALIEGDSCREQNPSQLRARSSPR